MAGVGQWCDRGLNPHAKGGEGVCRLHVFQLSAVDIYFMVKDALES